MTEQESSELAEYDPNELDYEHIEETVLVRIEAEKATLPLDTVAEVSKGFALLNKLLYEVLKDKYKDEIVDSSGNVRKITKYHPWTLEILKERRRTLDQIWKFQGGEALNEARKESAKRFADKIFDMQEPDIKKKHKDEFIEILEADVDEQRENENGEL